MPPSLPRLVLFWLHIFDAYALHLNCFRILQPNGMQILLSHAIIRRTPEIEQSLSESTSCASAQTDWSCKHLKKATL